MLKIEMSNFASLFKDLRVGDVFLDDDNELMMRIEDVEGDQCEVVVNCIHLATGEAFYKDATTPICPVNAKLIVEA